MLASSNCLTDLKASTHTTYVPTTISPACEYGKRRYGEAAATVIALVHWFKVFMQLVNLPFGCKAANHRRHHMNNRNKTPDVYSCPESETQLYSVELGQGDKS